MLLIIRYMCRMQKKEGHIGRKYIVEDRHEIAIKLQWNKKERKWVVSSYYINKTSE